MGRPKGTKASIEERIVEYFATVELKSAETLFNVVRGIVKTRGKQYQALVALPDGATVTQYEQGQAVTTTQTTN